MPKFVPSFTLKNLSPKVLKNLKIISFVIAIVLATGTLSFSIFVYRDILETQDQLLKLLKQQVSLTKKYAARFDESELARKEMEKELTMTKDLYAQAQISLQEIGAELEQTKLMLSKVGESNVQLKDAAKRARGQREKMVTQFDTLKSQNTELKTEIDTLQSQIRYLSAADIKNKDQANSLLKLYKTNINLVKSKIKEFKKQTHKTQAIVWTEKTQLENIVGNEGYLVKDGKAAIMVDQAPSGNPTSPRKFRPKIDVTFVN